MRGRVWWSALLAPVALVGGFLLAQSRQPPRYDALRDTLSSLAVHPATDPWIMTVGFAVLGACHIATAVALTAAGPPARVVLGLGGVATIAVAASPQPAALHVPAATVAFVALALWSALATRDVRQVGVPSAVLDVALLIWFFVELRSGSAAHHHDLVGLSERAVAVAEALTPIAVLAGRRRGSRASKAGGRSTGPG